MRVFIIYIVLATLAYYIFKKHIERQSYVKYLQEIGIPKVIIEDMSLKEVKAAALYLKRYAKTNIHFSVDDPDYDLLASIRKKYGIFT
jgi:hypothetical protein